MVDTREPLHVDVVEPAGREAGDDRPRRIRDLRGRDLVLVVALVALVLVPFVVALVRAYHANWFPSGDNANIAVRSLDVLSRHPPLTGLPTTSYLYGKHIFTYHPGPIEFYILAIPVRVLGLQTGMLLTAAAINAAAVFIALWVVYRRAGTTLMLWAGFLMLAVIWSGGTAILTDPLSSSMTRYSLLCTAVLAWAIAAGDVRLLPLGAFVASYSAQQHLAATLMVGALGAFTVIALAVSIVRRRRRGDTTAWRSVRRLAVVAVVIVGVCWVPVALDQAIGHPGNITKLRRLAQDDKRKTLGPGSGVVQAVHAIAPPTLLGRNDTGGLDVTRDVGWGSQAAAALVVAALAAIVWRERRRCRSLAFLAGTSLVVLGTGVVNGASVPESIERFRASLYSWTWTAGFLTWTAIGWAAGLAVHRYLERRGRALPGRALVLGPVALLVGTALIATSTAAVASADDGQTDPWLFAIERRAPGLLLDHLDRHRPVVVVSRGGAATSVTSSVVLGLVKAGMKVELTLDLARFLGKHRRYHPASDVSGVLVVSSQTPVADEPGTHVTSAVFEPEYSRLLDELTTEARSAPVVAAPDAQARMTAVSSVFKDVNVNAIVADLRRDPRTWLTTGVALEFIKRGVFAQPTFDLAKVRRFQQLLPHRHNVNGDERVEVRVLTPAELRAAALPELG